MPNFEFLNKLLSDIKSYNFVVTSTIDGKHNIGSKHKLGKAADVSVKNKTSEECRLFIEGMRAKGYRVLDERVRPISKSGIPQAVWSGPHIHIEEKSLSIKQDDEHYEDKTDRKDYNLISSTVYINSDKDISVSSFIEKYNLKIDVVELMNFLDNREQIYKSYNQLQKNKYKTASPLEIGLGAKISVPTNKIRSQKSIYSVNQTLVDNREYNCFVEAEIQRLLDDKEYRKININNSETNMLTGSIFKRNNNCSVWLWSKATDYEKGGELINITPFIMKLSTNVSENGGNFSITLPHISYDKTKENPFSFLINKINDDQYKSFIVKSAQHSLIDFNSEEIHAKYKDDNNEIKSNNKFFRRKNSYFHHVIQNNDLVFIRFEKLGTDVIFDQEEKVDSNSLPNNTYDMIGLIDTTTISSTAEDADQQITVSGRDLSKLIIDDGVFFFPVEFSVKDSEQIIKNSSKSKTGRRLVMPSTFRNSTINVGGLQGDTQFNFDKTQSIEEWTTFIFSQLTNIDICPDNLFSGYKEKTFIISRDDRPNNSGDFQYKKIQANGIWQIVKLVIDKEVGDRRIADSSLSTDTGSLINLIRKVCQKPFVDFFMDTYGDKFYFIIRKPPFSYKSFITNNCINLFENDIIADNFTFDDEVYSWYRLEAMGSFVESGNGAEMINLPAVMFPEYVEIFGSKVLHVQSNYLDFDQSDSDLSESNITAIRRQSKQDLDWLIESYAYLPFSRKGNITIKGDRRFKKGMNVRHFGTGEIFHIDAVDNVASFEDQSERYTTLQVSRGLVEKHLKKYFQIIDIKQGSEPSWKVNQEIFKFFIQRKQFYE